MDKSKQRKDGERYQEYRYCCNDCKATLELRVYSKDIGDYA